MSVNVPVNEAQKEKDINRKLQLYGIYQGKAWLSLAPGRWGYDIHNFTDNKCV